MAGMTKMNKMTWFTMIKMIKINEHVAILQKNRISIPLLRLMLVDKNIYDQVITS